MPPRTATLATWLPLALGLATAALVSSCGRIKPGLESVTASGGASGGDGSGGGPGGASGGAAEARGPGVGGTGGAAPGSEADGRVLRRLSNREYDNVVRDLLGDVTQPGRDFIADAYQNGFDNGSTGLTIQTDQATALQVAAEQLGARAASDLPRLLGGCDPTPSDEAAAACGKEFLARFPARAFRRPLSADEQQRLQAVYEAGAQAGGVALGAQLVVETVLQSPQFLYREELGAPPTATATANATATATSSDDVPPGFVRLTPYEVASELSFLLTGSLPDNVLWDAVQGGHFRTTDDIRREARRLVEGEGARATLRGFLHQWLATDRLPTVIKDPAMYGRFNRALANSMSGELDRFYDWILGAGGGSLRALFTSTHSFVDAPLAALYGVDPPTPGDGTGFGAVTLDADHRRGVLTRAGFLSVHANLDSSGPITRGVFMLDQILCLPPSPPPANIPTAPSAAEDAENHRTTRARFDTHVSNPGCAACHGRIDGFGFGFEEFDGIGAYRTQENDVPVDTSGTITGSGDADGPFNGVSELSERLVGSRRLRDCFLRQVHRFAMGRVETTDDRPLLDMLGGTFSADTPLSTSLLALVEQPAFVLRRAPTSATTTTPATGGTP